MSTTARIVKIAYDPNDREAWLELRKRGLGGSDSSAVIGLNPWVSKLALYADKMGLLPEKQDNEAMYWGRALEDLVAAKFEEVTGKKTQRVNFLLMNEQFPFGFANIDRRVVGEKALLEVKTTSSFTKSDFENGDVPPHYLVQIYHYLAITNYDRAYLAVLVGGQKFYHYTIERNQGEIDALMDAEQRFWEEHVVPGIPPEPDGSESAQEVLDLTDRGEGTALLMDQETAFEQLQRVTDEIKFLQEEKDSLRQQIIQQMGQNNRGQALTWKCSYLPQTRNSVNGELLKQFYPEAYEKCVKTSSYPVFRARKMKEDK